MSNGKASGDARYRGVPKDSDCNGTVVVEESTVSLKKRVGLVSGTALIVGTMIDYFPRTKEHAVFKA